MFEKEGIKYALEETIGTECLSKPIEDFHFIDLADEQQEKAQCWKDGAEYGYNKANEWHYVKNGDYPKEKGNYLVAWKRTHHVEEFGEWGFDVDLFNADEGYFEGVGDYVIAWKEIVLPKEIEQMNKKQKAEVNAFYEMYKKEKGEKMLYNFKCTKCGKAFEVEIPIKNYDAEKGNQICPACGEKMERVIEWAGIATAEGQGWFGKSDGSKAI